MPTRSIQCDPQVLKKGLSIGGNERIKAECYKMRMTLDNRSIKKLLLTMFLLSMCVSHSPPTCEIDDESIPSRFESGLIPRHSGFTSNFTTTWGEQINDSAEAICQIGGYLYVTGRTVNDMMYNTTDIIVLKINGTTGDIVWNSTWDGAAPFYPASDVGLDICTDGSALYITGRTDNGLPGLFDMVLIKMTSETGSIVWNRTYGEAVQQDVGNKIFYYDGCVVTIGSSGSYLGVMSVDIRLLKWNATTGTCIDASNYGTTGIDRVEDAWFNGTIIIITSNSSSSPYGYLDIFAKDFASHLGSGYGDAAGMSISTISGQTYLASTTLQCNAYYFDPVWTRDIPGTRQSMVACRAPFIYTCGDRLAKWNQTGDLEWDASVNGSHFPRDMIVTSTGIFYCGQTTSKESFVVRVNELFPLPDFEANVTHGIAGFTNISFHYTGTNLYDLVSLQWNFGDGSPNSSQPELTYMYLLSGSFTVTLTVQDSDGEVAVSRKNSYIVVEPDYLPRAAFWFNASRIIVGECVSFTPFPHGNAPKTHTWDFRDGSDLSNESAPVHRFLSSGIFAVNHTVVDADGDRDSDDYPIEVQEDLVPQPDFYAPVTSAINGTSQCVIQFYFNGTTGNDDGSGTWDFGDGTNASFSSYTNPTHYYQNPGNYSVSLSYTDWDGDLVNFTRDQYIRIQADVLPDFSIVIEPLSPIVGEWTFFSVAGSLGNLPVTYQWQLPRSYNYTGGVFHRYFTETETGTFLINLTIRDADGDVVTVRKNITIVADISPEPSFAADRTSITAGESVHFTFTGSLGNEPVQLVNWSFGDGTAHSTDLHPTHEFHAPGVYDITLTIIDRDGDNSTITVSSFITVMLPDPPAGVDPVLLVVIGSAVAGIAAIGLSVSIKRRRFHDRTFKASPS
ncbi:MAG: PKD domain-containing protein [Candidatus Lokiarchaeota archaeon]|nr:PKD domain-containing protein [Candidatus Lokiarchaeota archaeon]